MGGAGGEVGGGGGGGGGEEIDLPNLPDQPEGPDLEQDDLPMNAGGLPTYTHTRTHTSCVNARTHSQKSEQWVC